jgi:hypothetical protein
MPRMITTSALVWLSLSVVASVPLVRRTRYNEVEAKFLLNLAAGAYAPKPDACLNKLVPFPMSQDLLVSDSARLRPTKNGKWPMALISSAMRMRDYARPM